MSVSTQKREKILKICVDILIVLRYYEHTDTYGCAYEHRKEMNKMLTNNERKTIERLTAVIQSMDEMQKAQLCAFAEGLAMALEHSKRAS